MFDDVLDALHFKFGMCCEETDGNELGASGTGSGFGALRCGCGQKEWEGSNARAYVSLP